MSVNALAIPGHGRICNESEVAEYRDMTTIIRDRIQLLVEKGMTLAQMFIEAIYADLMRARRR